MTLTVQEMDLNKIESTLAKKTNLKITYFNRVEKGFEKDNTVVFPMTRKDFIGEYKAAQDEGKNMTFEVVREEPTKFIFGKLYIRNDGKVVYSYQIKGE